MSAKTAQHSRVVKSERRNGFITGWPVAVRESEAPGRPGLGGRAVAEHAPRPAGVPVSSRFAARVGRAQRACWS